MKNCIFSGDSCTVCGAPKLNARQLCGSWKSGLGDRIAEGLSAVGITKDRVQAVAHAVGIEDCGCAERQQLLNQLGHKLGIGSPPQPPSA